MKKITFVFTLSVLIAICYGVRETCSNSGFQYRSGASFQSVKQNGQYYNCTCHGRGCKKIICSQNEINSNSEEEDVLLVESGSTNTTENETQDEDGCNRNGQIIHRGSSYIMRTPENVRKICTCPINGPSEVTCKNLQCHLPDPPERNPNLAYTRANQCYDRWQRRGYARGTKYIRTRYMNEDGTLLGLYSCICTRNFISCTPIDIPCCDLETGNFVPKTHRFITTSNGEAHQCTCNGGTNPSTDCIRVSNENLLVQALSSTNILFRNRRFCVDSHTGKLHSPGAQWIQNRRHNQLRCRCVAHGTSVRAKCNHNRVNTN